MTLKQLLDLVWNKYPLTNAVNRARHKLYGAEGEEHVSSSKGTRISFPK